MSSAGNRKSFHEAFKVASDVISSFEPYCERIEIAGSIRRLNETIGDIEIVAIPRKESTLDLFRDVRNIKNLLWEQLDYLRANDKIRDAKPKRWGNIYRAFYFQTMNKVEYKVDLFTCDEDNWGNTLLIRTGAQEFSQWMVTKKQYGGALPDELYHQNNRLGRLSDGETIPIPEEQTWFDLCGLPYIEPEYRQDMKWFQFITQENKS
jgi:DNA polymerase/3'-5' exonuclease PolX